VKHLELLTPSFAPRPERLVFSAVDGKVEIDRLQCARLIRGKKVMVGAIDVASNIIETPEEVANTLRKALQFVDADKLYPCTNCGMAPLARHVARGRLNALRLSKP